MIRKIMLLVAAAALSACGLAETGAVGAAAGASAAEQGAQARQQLDRVQAELDAAQKAAADARGRTEAMAQ